MNNNKRKKRLPAEAFFHTTIENYNCAQAIMKARQEELHLSNEDIEHMYRSKGGGRAEGGMCGAIYAAIKLLNKDKAEELIIKANNILGGTTCDQLKGILKIPCPKIVKIIDELIEENKN